MCGEPRRTWLILFCFMPRKKRALQKHKRAFNNEAVFENTHLYPSSVCAPVQRKREGEQILDSFMHEHYAIHFIQALKLSTCFKTGTVHQRELYCPAIDLRTTLWANKNKNTSQANGLSRITPHDSLLTMKESNLIDTCWITALVRVQPSIGSLEERLHYVALISYLIFFLVPFQYLVFCLIST